MPGWNDVPSDTEVDDASALVSDHFIELSVFTDH